MLEGLADVPWFELEHAFGKATDIPVLLRELASKRKQIRQQAALQLSRRLVHQSDKYTATLASIPFLLELLVVEEVADKHLILQILQRSLSRFPIVFSAQSEVGQRVEEKVDEYQALLVRINEAVRGGLPVYHTLLEHSEDEVRKETLDLLTFFDQDVREIAGWLHTQSQRETNPEVKAYFLNRLGSLLARIPHNLAQKDYEHFRKYFEEHSADNNQPDLVRIEAACSLMLVLGEGIPSETIDQLLMAYTSVREVLDISRAGDILSTISSALASIDSERGLPAFFKLLAVIPANQVHFVIEPFLDLVFPITDSRTIPIPILSSTQQNAIAILLKRLDDTDLLGLGYTLYEHGLSRERNTLQDLLEISKSKTNHL